MRNEPLGVYLHIPFCRKKCAYCDFCSTARWDEALLDSYLEALLAQMTELLPEGQRVDTVYIGGGTPSVFGGRRLTRLLEALSHRADLAQSAEITVEVNPESAGEALFRQLKAAGVNRISMGVQSADDRQLAALGRLHTFRQAAEMAGRCRRLCTENLSLDLMFGLPGQDMGQWMKSLEAVCGLEPAHISCYLLKLEEGTPLYRKSPALPEEDLQADMYLAAVEMLERRGYGQYEISNFARPGKMSRHNARYWDLSPYLGLGCSAHSLFEDKRFYFDRDLEGYIAGRRTPVLEEEDELARQNRLGEYLMLSLRTVRGLEPETIEQRWGRAFAPFARRLEPYASAGFALNSGGLWRLTPKGFLVSNRIIADVLEAL